jgi:molybdopterin-guanine dinucleotide biosynthesis protein A
MATTMTTDSNHVLVLAGGASGRMGSDKRSVLIDGEPMLLRTLARLGDSPVVLLIDPGRPLDLVLPSHVRVVPDSRPGEGPLAALEAGLRAVADEVVVVVGADMPWLEPSVLRLLVERLAAEPSAEVACLVDTAGPRPLPLALRRTAVLTRLSPLLDTGERRLRALAADAATVPLERWLPLDPTGATLRDVDTPADLVAAP